MTQGTQTPTHLWFVATLALLWSASGAFDYTMIQVANVSYSRMLAMSYEVPLETVISYFRGWPIWVHASWAIGVWGGMLGALLLLGRSRFAFHAFLASITGALVSFVYRFLSPLEGASASLGAVLLTVLGFGASVLLIRYAKVMTAAGVLR